MLRAAIGSCVTLAAMLAWWDVRQAVAEAKNEAPRAQALVEFKSPRGFSLRYPAGWTVASDQQRDQVAQEAQKHANQGNGKNVPGPAFLATNLQGGAFKENVNVVVTNGAPAVDEKGAREYADLVAKQMRDVGWNPTDIVSECATFNGRKAISLQWKVRMPGAPFPIRQWQVAIPAGGRTYCITCSAHDSAFERCKPIFATVLDSVEVQGGSGWDSLSPILRGTIIGAIIGGLVGGAVALVRKLSRRDPRKTYVPPPPDFGPPL
jgi:hypothetical protein